MTKTYVVDYGKVKTIIQRTCISDGGYDTIIWW